VIDRRTFLGTLAGGLLAAPLAAEAQPAGRTVPRVGILSPPEPLTRPEVFQRGFRDPDYTDGDGLRIEYRSSEWRDDRFPALAADLVALKVDVIIAVTPPAIRAAQKTTATIPIVMVLSGDSVGSMLVHSLARPGGNTTGPATLTADLAPKRLEVFKEAVPKLRELAVLVNPVYPGWPEAVAQMSTAGHALGVEIRSFEVRKATDVDTAFAAIRRSRPDGLLVMPDPITSSSMARIVEFAATNRLPAMDGQKRFPESGGFMSYGIDYAEHVRRGIRYVDRILKGAKPADLPVEQPTKFELVINLKTAKALGLMIPPSLLQRADQVIE
jgi:putative ABC transport system substrate-binding protein